MRYLILFVSTTTLFCCALPALLVFLGFGAVVASLVSTLPILVTLSEYKAITFTVAALLIAAGWVSLSRSNSCPIDSNKEACSRLKKHSRLIMIVSTIFWGIGFIVAIIAPIFI